MPACLVLSADYVNLFLRYFFTKYENLETDHFLQSAIGNVHKWTHWRLMSSKNHFFNDHHFSVFGSFFLFYCCLQVAAPRSLRLVIVEHILSCNMANDQLAWIILTKRPIWVAPISPAPAAAAGSVLRFLQMADSWSYGILIGPNEKTQSTHAK